MCSKWNNLKPEEMPYEKCMTLGAESLTDAELLAILLRTGTKNHTVLEVAEKVLSMNPEFDGLVGMMHFTPEEYRQVEGIGHVKAVQLSVVGEIAHRIWQRAKRVKHTVFSRPELVAEYYMEDLRYLDHEVVRILYLDYQMQLLKDKLLSTGTCCRSAISSREIFIEALGIHAACFIMVHNHPSGDPAPSEEDIQFTRELEQAAQLVGIRLIDHVIIGDHRYISFREQELISGKQEE